MRSIILTAFLFIFILGWKTNEFTDWIIISSILVTGFAFTISGMHFNRYHMVIFVVFFILIFYSLVIAEGSLLINYAADFQPLLRAVRALINFIGAISIVYIYYTIYGNNFSKHLMLHIYAVLVIHAVILLVMSVDASIRSQVYSITWNFAVTAYDTGPRNWGVRVSGVTVGLASTSLVQCFGLLIAPALLAMWRDKISVTLAVVISSPLLVNSLFLTGRSGMLIGIVLAPWVIYLNFLGDRQRVLQMFRLGFGLLIVFTLMPTFFNFLSPQYRALYFQRAGIVLDVLQFEEVQDIEILQSMYFLPDNFVVTIFGSSNLGRSDALAYIPSDIGYVLIIHAIGVIGLLMTLFPLLFGISSAWKVRNFDVYLGSSTVILVVASLIFNGKEIALLTRHQWSIQALLICACFLLLAQRENQEQSDRKKIPHSLSVRTAQRQDVLQS